ncbi:hypothetical protein [Confluentibacter flavum]|uniref:Uncharacterized protein n=1 Tax=Confluentibacter flavum TaxID=1909700 RepID=A0A2N3HK32_9FLAO|nr:hypothetical protein [Confluentibacter flavum]PKQ45335.1 hypothetical protein CSW08_08965 [Confluentibacter flavum]
MKLKWCILLVVIGLIGIASQQQVCLPNQEIVLRFTNDGVTSDEAQNAIAIVKKQLLTIGANNIHVKESQKGGSLKITYYSDTDVASIKKLLSREKDIELGYISSSQDNKSSKSPSKNNPSAYDIDVFELKKQDAGFEGGKYAIELKSENIRFFIPNLLVFNTEIGYNDLESVLNQTYKFRKNSAIAINITSNKIPDGRAGPLVIRFQNHS